MASYGIHGVVDNYGDLPEAGALDLGTVFLVRGDAGAPSGAGLYWVGKGSSGREWSYLDALSLQRAGEVPFNNDGTGIAAEDVQAALAELDGRRDPVHEIHVDPALGSDADGDGSRERPYATINHAYGEVESFDGNWSVETQKRWVAEKLILRLAPGVYTEGGTEETPNNVSLRMKRARTMLYGEGVQILGNINWSFGKQDFPFESETGSGLYETENNPWPFTGRTPKPTLELQGIGGGIEGGFTTQGFAVRGAVRILPGDATGWAKTYNTAWGDFYVMCDRILAVDGLRMESGDGEEPALRCTVEINDSAFDGGFLGAFHENPAVTESRQGFLFLKAHNSQMKSTLGPELRILEIDNCRLKAIDRTGGGDGTGTYERNIGVCGRASIDVNYSGITNSPFVSDTLLLGHSATPCTDPIKMDANSLASFLSHAPDLGAGLPLVLTDRAEGVAYDGETDQAGVWSGDAPGDLQEAVKRIAVALQTEIASPIS